MQKSFIVCYLILLTLVLTSCVSDDIEETTILDECILDEACTYSNVGGWDNPNEVMFNMVREFSFERNLDLPIEHLSMTIERTQNRIEFDINHNQSTSSLLEIDMNNHINMLEELYNYTNLNLVPVDRILLKAGNISNNNFTVSYNPEDTYVSVFNYIDVEYTGDIIDFYNQISDIVSNANIDDYSISLVYNDVQVILSYNHELFESIHLSFYGCDENPSCNERNQLDILENLQILLVDERIEISNN